VDGLGTPLDMTPKETEEDNIHSFRRWKTDGLINSKFYPMRHPSGKDEGKSPTTPESLLTFSSFTSYLEKSDMLRYYSSQQNKDPDGTPKGLDISRLAQPEVFLKSSLEKPTPMTISEPNKENSFHQEPFNYKFNLNQGQVSQNAPTPESVNNAFINMNVNMSYLGQHAQPGQPQDFKQIPVNVNITNNFNQRSNFKKDRRTKSQYKFSQFSQITDPEAINKFNNLNQFPYSQESINNYKNAGNNFSNYGNFHENYAYKNTGHNFSEYSQNRRGISNFHEENLNYNNFDNFENFQNIGKHENMVPHQIYPNFNPEDCVGLPYSGNQQYPGNNNPQFLNPHISGHPKNFNGCAYPHSSNFMSNPTQIKHKMIPNFSNNNYLNHNNNHNINSNVQFTNQHSNTQIKKQKYENAEPLKHSSSPIREARTNKNQKPPLIYYMNLNNEELVKHAYSLAKDQAGCRYLQKKIDEEPQTFPLIIYPKVVENLIELMNDAFGNYLIQKLLEYLPDEKLFHILAIVKFF
jgi:hypothetical protein